MPINFSGPNKWQRVFFETYLGNPENRKIKAPLIPPFELPLIFETHVLAITATYFQAKPRWRTSGYLTQTYTGIDLNESPVTNTPSSPTTGVDAARQRIGLNVVELVRFPPLSPNFYLWFDPVHWLPKLTLTVWEFTGEEPVLIEDSLRLIRTDLVQIDNKISAINQPS